MAAKIGINGFGRIGRCVARALYERGVTDVEGLANRMIDLAQLVAKKL